MENAGVNPPPQQPPPTRMSSKRRRKTDGGEVLLDMVNDDGTFIDLTALERGGDDVYNEELRRRTAGMESEEELLRFIESLNGDWYSRKQKRICVDAREFSDVLPVGWKVVVALQLRRGDGRPVLYFLKYISPKGEEFPSCKEVACFLQSQFVSLSANNKDMAVLQEQEEDDNNLVDVEIQEDTEYAREMRNMNRRLRPRVTDGVLRRLLFCDVSTHPEVVGNKQDNK